MPINRRLGKNIDYLHKGNIIVKKSKYTNNMEKT